MKDAVQWYRAELMRFSVRRYFAFAWSRASAKAVREAAEGIGTIERAEYVLARNRRAVARWEGE